MAIILATFQNLRVKLFQNALFGFALVLLFLCYVNFRAVIQVEHWERYVTGSPSTCFMTPSQYSRLHMKYRHHGLCRG